LRDPLLARLRLARWVADSTRRADFPASALTNCAEAIAVYTGGRYNRKVVENRMG
jgi:hypothetical protein